MNKGGAYFTIMFDDSDLTVPVVQTLIYSDSVIKGSKIIHIFDEIKSDGGRAAFFIHDENLNEILLDGTELVSRLSALFKNSSR